MKTRKERKNIIFFSLSTAPPLFFPFAPRYSLKSFFKFIVDSYLAKFWGDQTISLSNIKIESLELLVIQPNVNFINYRETKILSLLQIKLFLVFAHFSTPKTFLDKSTFLAWQVNAPWQAPRKTKTKKRGFIIWRRRTRKPIFQAQTTLKKLLPKSRENYRIKTNKWKIVILFFNIQESSGYFWRGAREGVTIKSYFHPFFCCFFLFVVEHLN